MWSALLSVLYSIIFIPPTGIIIGILTERIAKRGNPIPSILHARLWNSLSKTISAILTVYLLALLCLIDKPNDNNDDMGDTSPDSQLSLLLLTMFLYVSRLVLLAACTQIGTSLQPVGLTGGIACGKSTVSSMLSEGLEVEDSRRGDKEQKEAFCVIDLDQIAHDVLDPNKLSKSERAYERVVNEFGTDILVNYDHLSEKQKRPYPPPIDRRKLGDIVFSDNTRRRKLNSITHPLITKIMLKRIILEGYSKSNIVLADVPLIYEAGWTMRALFGIIIVVATTPTIQLERLLKRNKDLTKKQCEERIASQMDITEKAKLADLVIWNNGSVDELKREVERTRADVLDRCRFVVFGRWLDYSALVRILGGFYGILWFAGKIGKK